MAQIECSKDDNAAIVGGIQQSLADLFGFSQFRPGQEQTVKQLLGGFSSLAIFPTGSGKSLSYQFSAIHLPH
ncbi:MAG: ATP-dependent DNA helicase RecQ, partial [Gammaproteobacteria bacterium]